MTVAYIDFLVEEPSMEVFLRGLLPRVLSDIPFAIHPFQGKDEMMGRLLQRLQGYAAWLPEDHRIVVLVDRDDDACQELKQQLELYARQAGLATRSSPQKNHYTVINRVVVEELEAWYFGDWSAVCAAYPRVPQATNRRARYRDPDGISGGTWEAFERVLRKAGYFRTGLRKQEAARTIVPYIDLENNKSHSFNIFLEALLDLRGQGGVANADN